MKNLFFKIKMAVTICLLSILSIACNRGADTTEDSAASEDGMMDTTSETTMMDTSSMDNTMMAGMHQHMQEMQHMKMTGDPDYDFAQMMTMHHQGAIRMSENELANGTDARLKEIANRTITSSKADIQKLQNYTSTNKAAAGDTAATMRMMKPMHAMMEQMHGKDMMGNMSTDQHFAQMMVHHHNSGIEMAREYLKQGKNQQLKTLAQKIIDEQQKEVKEMQAWQQQNK